ncbi:MAG: VanZ family protein [Proteobacteria bacterium]|nr:VanZ family protein [Pseudomonadota bacterium]
MRSATRFLQAGPGPRARRAWQLLLVLLMLAVCALAFAPHPPPALDTGWDKRNHLLAFGSLACVAELAFWPARWRRCKVLLGLLAFGGFIEIVQSQIPERSAEWGDLLADGLGIALGLAVIAALVRLGRRRASKSPSA